MIARIVEVAHAVACWCLNHHDYDRARRALRLGLEVQPTAQLLHQDWASVEDRFANRTQAMTVIDSCAEPRRDTAGQRGDGLHRLSPRSWSPETPGGQS